MMTLRKPFKLHAAPYLKLLDLNLKPWTLNPKPLNPEA